MKVFKKIISIMFFAILPLLFATVVSEYFALLAEAERLSAFQNVSGSETLAYGLTKAVIFICSTVGFFLSYILIFLNSFKILKYFSGAFVILFIIIGILGVAA
ncbi:MAG: hypothetical protein IJN95_03595 [Clostridia bacterium]|nr:hypothetical protein [Clostridia bacterium]